MVRVYTYVSGDLLHVGHLRAMMQAKALGDYLIVGVLTDEAIASYKRQSVIPFEERLELISHLDVVDEVVRQDDVDPTENLKKMNVDILTHGDDWEEGFPGSAYMKSVGKQVVRTKYYQGQCTTHIIEQIKSREDLP